MEDIVAVRVKLNSGTSRYFLTWGRIPDVVDPKPLLDIVAKNLNRFDLGGVPTAIELCFTLQDASEEPYFYETLFRMTQQKIPVGSGYRPWRKRVLGALKEGQELYYLGRRRWKGKSAGRLNIDRSIGTTRSRKERPAS